MSFVGGDGAAAAPAGEYVRDDMTYVCLFDSKKQVHEISLSNKTNESRMGFYTSSKTQLYNGC